MKLNKHRAVAILIFTIVILSCKTAPNQSFETINLPLYSKGYDVKEGFDDLSKCKYLIYSVKEAFPAEAVVRYLINEFEKMGIQKYTADGQGMMRWESFNKSTGSWEETNTLPAKYVATWTDPKKEKLFLLQLYYKYNGKESDWENVLHVDCKVCKYFKEYENPQPPKPDNKQE